MRILRVAQKLYPEVPGGGAYHVHAMSRDQAAMGHDVTVLTVSDDGSLPQREERDGYTVVRRSPSIELLGNAISLGVAQFLRETSDFDVIHAHSHLYLSTNLAALIRRVSDIPLAITNHGLYSQNAPEWLFDLYLRSLGRWTFNRSDIVFCYTEEDRARVQGFGVDSQIEVVANGVDTERFTPNGPESGLIDHEGPVVLFVGRLVDGKRPQDAVEAFAAVRESRPNAKLYLCGDGPLREDLGERVARLGIADAVTFLGQLVYDEMSKLYRSADVLVLPSRAEGLPRTVLEAFATEVPAVVSNLEQITDIVERAGVTVPVGDVSGFADALEDLVATDARRVRLGTQGRELVTERFDWTDTVKQTTEALAERVGTTDT